MSRARILSRDEEGGTSNREESAEKQQNVHNLVYSIHLEFKFLFTFTPKVSRAAKKTVDCREHEFRVERDE